MGADLSAGSNQIDMGTNHSSECNEIEMEMVPDEYMDSISYEFAYDPVRLPVDQDPTQSLYNRKTLETIWETKCHAENPFTRQWFNAKSAICQRELRQEMEDYIKLQNFPTCRGAKLEVIEEYTKILEEGEMKQYLDTLGKSHPKQVRKVWKQINLLRLYCEFHSKNIETFRSLHGFRYLNEFVIKMTMLLKSNIIGTDTEETAWDVCKEICRAIHVMGLKTEDIHDVKICLNRKSKQINLIRGYIKMIEHAFFNTEGYAKIESLMLRIFIQIFSDMNAEAKRILRKKSMESIVGVTGPWIVVRKLSGSNAGDISSEDLYHGISILQTSWVTISWSLDHPNCSKVLANAIIICIAREINRSEEAAGLREGQLLEAEAEARCNSEALEKGLCLVKDLLMTEGPSAGNLVGRGFNIVTEIVRMFKHFTSEDGNDDESNGALLCAKKGCKIFECVHSRIAQLGLDIRTAISRYVELPDCEVLFKFLN